VVQRDQQISCGAAVMSNEFQHGIRWITELGKARQRRIYGEDSCLRSGAEKSGALNPFLPLLTDLALARTLIVHLVIRYGPERGWPRHGTLRKHARTG